MFIDNKTFNPCFWDNNFVLSQIRHLNVIFDLILGPPGPYGRGGKPYNQGDRYRGSQRGQFYMVYL